MSNTFPFPPPIWLPPLPRSPPPPPPPNPTVNLPMLYYSLAVLGIAAIVLAAYNMLIVRLRHSRLISNQFVGMTGRNRGLEIPRSSWLSSFKYKRAQEQGSKDSDSECAVCLSVFEEGEEVRLLPDCKHCFHAPCIDMWLYSHYNCPLCRAPVIPPPSVCHPQIERTETSRQGLPVLPSQLEI